MSSVYKVNISHYDYTPMGDKRLELINTVVGIFNIEVKMASNWVNNIPTSIIIDDCDIDIVTKLKPHLRCELSEIKDIDVIREYRLNRLGI